MMVDNRAWLKSIAAADDARKAAFAARLRGPNPADELRDLRLRVLALESALESAMKGETTDDTNNTDS